MENNTEKMKKIRWLMDEIKKIQEENDCLDRLEEGPCGLFSAWPTGMPRGTNNPIAALLQRMDVNDALDQIENYCRELEISA